MSSHKDVPFIPLDIVKEILLRLDAKTLFQCSFVCRDWIDLITSLDFISCSSKQTFGSQNQILLIKFCHCTENVETYGRNDIHFSYCPYCRVTYSVHSDNDPFHLLHPIENPDIDDFKVTKVIGISNGLVCLANELPFKLILWNPTIRKYVWLPLKMTWDERRLSILGFGFDRINNDLKVVNIVYHYRGYIKSDNEFDSVWVFSYVTWSWKWKRPTYSILHQCRFISSSSVFFNGVLYWIALHTEEYYYFILTFDLTHEVFGQILFPSDACPYPCLNSIVSTGESLLLIQRNHEDSSFTIWTLKQFGNQERWANTLSTTTKIVPDQILGVRKNGDLILEMGDGQIHKYNPTNLTHSLVATMENSVFFSYYTESLYLLEKGEDVHSY